MKHPSRWPWILRYPIFGVILIALWWGPIGMAVWGLKAFGVFESIGGGATFILAGAVLFGWSSFIMKFVIHTRVEPLFNIRSLQNPHKELFTPEPVRSVRDWLRLMFFGR